MSLTNLPTGCDALRQALAVQGDVVGELLGREADRERAQADAVLADLLVAVRARRRAEDRRVRRTGAASAGPAAARPSSSACRRPGTRPSSTRSTMCSSASRHCSRVSLGSTSKPSSSGAGRRAAGAEVDAAVGDEVEHRDRLRGADRVVVRLRQQPHAVPDADVLGAGRDRAVEHLGVRAVRVLLEEVVLDGPERVEAHLVAEDGLLDRVLVGLVLLARRPRARAPGSRRRVRTSWSA